MFRRERMRITDTLSFHEDTDFVSFRLLVGSPNGGRRFGSVMKSVGGVNNGDVAINMEFGPIDVNNDMPLIMLYQIVNSGNHDPTTFMTTSSKQLMLTAR
jgi:hypothetical protein